MAFLAALWMPIVLSAVFVFVASAIIWMASPLHKHDYKNPGEHENTMLDFFRNLNLEPGVYYVPWCQGKNMKDPAVQAKMKAGPYVQTIVLPGTPSMGKMLAAWMFHLLIVSVFVAYVAHLALPASDAPYLKVFQIAGTAALLAHAGYALPLCIWHGQPWAQLPGRVVDGVIYALLTAGTFGWLWPHAETAIKVVLPAG